MNNILCSVLIHEIFFLIILQQINFFANFHSAPPKWVFEPKDTVTTAGESIVLHCQATGSPIPRILWKKLSGNVTFF